QDSEWQDHAAAVERHRSWTRDSWRPVHARRSQRVGQAIEVAMRRTVLLLGGITTAASGFVACGGAPPQVAVPLHAAPSKLAELSPPLSKRPGVAASAEVGGLDGRAADQSFRASLDGLQACIRDGVERLDFIGGSIEFAVKVDASQHATQV